MRDVRVMPGRTGWLMCGAILIVAAAFVAAQVQDYCSLKFLAR